MRHAMGRPLALALALALPIAASPGEARADAAAQVLFDEGRKLMGEGKFAEACPKLEESQRLDPGVGTQYHLANCWEQLGRTASAWSLFLEVAAASKAAGKADREKVARERAAALEPKLMRLAIQVTEGAPEGVQVTRDGAAIGKAQWGTPVPMDPGKHTVAAWLTGRPPYTTTVELTAPGSTETVTIPLPETWGAPIAAPPPPPGAVAEPKMKRRSGGMIAGGVVAASVGVIAGTIGLGLLALCQEGSAGTTGARVEVGCKPAAGWGLLVGGVVGIGAGIPLIVIGAKKVPAQPEQGRATLLVGPTGAAVRWTM